MTSIAVVLTALSGGENKRFPMLPYHSWQLSANTNWCGFRAKTYAESGTNAFVRLNLLLASY